MDAGGVNPQLRWGFTASQAAQLRVRDSAGRGTGTRPGGHRAVWGRRSWPFRWR